MQRICNILLHSLYTEVTSVKADDLVGWGLLLLVAILDFRYILCDFWSRAFHQKSKMAIGTGNPFPSSSSPHQITHQTTYITLSIILNTFSALDALSIWSTRSPWTSNYLKSKQTFRKQSIHTVFKTEEFKMSPLFYHNFFCNFNKQIYISVSRMFPEGPLFPVRIVSEAFVSSSELRRRRATATLTLQSRSPIPEVVNRKAGQGTLRCTSSSSSTTSGFI